MKIRSAEWRGLDVIDVHHAAKSRERRVIERSLWRERVGRIYDLAIRGEPLVGFEPTTARLRIESSTPELQWRDVGCPGADSNRDAFRHYPLKIACLPVSPPGREAGKIAVRSDAVNFKQRQALEVKWAACDRNSVEEYHSSDRS